MNLWLMVALLAIGTLVLRALGPALAGGREPPPTLLRVVNLVGPALIAALIVTNAFTEGRTLVLDARAAGLAVAGVALLLRTPLIVAGLIGALACALLRAFV